MGAIGTHETEVVAGSWDGPANEARLRSGEDRAYYARAFAWQDPDADPTTKAAYRFIHHEVDAEGEPGAANMTACSAGIAVLNGARGGTTIPDEDRAGVYRHLASHMGDDEGREVPELRGYYEGESPAELALKDGLRQLPSAKSTAVAVKAESEDTLTVAGWGVIFGGQDLEWTRFTKATDYWLDKLGQSKVTLYDHGFNDAVRAEVIGQATVTAGEDGLWVEAELAKHNRYVQQIQKLLQAGALGWSSGAIAHLVDAEEAPDGILVYKSWPIVEMSLTPTPAEPRTLGVSELRSLVEHVEALKALLPEDPPVEGGSAQPGEATKQAGGPRVENVQNAGGQPAQPPDVEVEGMELNELAAQVTSLAAKTEQMGDLITKLLNRFEDEPALKNAGFVTVDGGKADKNVRNFADFLVAVRRNDVKRLAEVYKTVKTLNEGDSSAGGILVPPDIRTDVLQLGTARSPILSLITTIPVSVESGTWPALDQYITPTAGVGQTAFAANVVATATAEAGALTETEPKFVDINWQVHKIGGVTYVSNELAADSPASIEALLRMLFGIAVGAKREYYVLRGSGAGEPRGILNAPAAIGVATNADNTFAWVDALGMLARFKIVTQAANVRWVMHPGVLPDLGASGWVTGNVSRKIEDLGYGPFVTNEHMPQDDNDDVLLADFGAYLMFERQNLAIAFSEHAAFTSDKGAWRFTERVDGQPWVKAPVTLADPQGSYTVSPFVFHDD